MKETWQNEQRIILTELRRRLSLEDFNMVLRLLELEYQVAMIEEAL